jgi:transposase
MPRPLSEDLRKRIVKKREEGYSEADVSQMFGVSTSSVYRFFKRQRESGDLKPKKMGQPEGSKLNPHKDLIQGWIQKEPGVTLEELTARLADELDIHVHHTTVMRALSRWGYSYKKNSVRKGAKPH